MSTSTTNLNLLKPDPAENWSIQNHFNANMGKIDDFAGLFMIDFGSKSVSAFHDALSSTMSGVANGQSVSFTVNLTDSVSPMSSGAHTGIATRSSSTRVNIILQRSGSATNENYVGSLTSNGWSWDKVATKSQIDAINSQLNTFTAITPTVYSDRVNIVLSNCYKIGRWVIVYLQLHSNQALNQNTALTGFPLPAAKFGLPVNISGANAEIRTSAGDGMVVGGIAANTDFVISGVYNTLQD